MSTELEGEVLPEDTEQHGNWWSIKCPYCDHENEEIYSSVRLEREEGSDGDSMQCSNCERDFIVRFYCEGDELRATQMEPDFENARQRFRRNCDDYTERWKRMILNVVKKDDDVFMAYLCHRPDSRMQSCMIIITREGITICGDWTPLRGGCSSALGYGVGWFSGVLSEGYLCEKFYDVKELSDDHALLCAIQKAFSDRMQENREEAVDYPNHLREEE